MPTRSSRICAHPGCNTVIPYGGSAYCDAHRDIHNNNKTKTSRSYDVMRPERHKFYHTARWQKVRNHYIRQHPLCEICFAEGKICMAKIVDHIIEIQDGGALTNPSNLQSLCAYHHAIKTKAEQKRREGGGVNKIASQS